MVTAPPPRSARPRQSQAHAPPTSRLAWLDALRGIGALAVVVEHITPLAFPALRPYWFNLGTYGVLVFFLVSGYIIPASLERKGDVRTFWISRLFRLYPLYLVVLGAALAISWWLPIRPQVPRDASAVAAHATMLLDVVHVAGAVGTMWTLSYEMVFYLIVTALFVAGAHRRSGVLAIAFSALALVCGLLITAPLTDGPWPAYVSFFVFMLGMACLLTGFQRTLAAYALGLTAVVLLIAGSYVPWFGAAILGAMFAGTAIYRWERAEGPLWQVFAAGLLIVLSPVWAHQAGWWWVQPWAWLATLAMAAATFAVGMALKNRRLPGVLAWLGLISYSVYLVHYPLLRVFMAIIGDIDQAPWAAQIAATAVFVALVLGLSWLTYRLVEAPMQRYGKRVAKRFATAPVPVPVPAPSPATETVA